MFTLWAKKRHYTRGRLGLVMSTITTGEVGKQPDRFGQNERRKRKFDSTYDSNVACQQDAADFFEESSLGYHFAIPTGGN
jgi:hypothetical protein